MAAIGASPDYYTYDAFDEVNFSTGGNDVRVATGGIGIGLVTKRGTNAFHGDRRRLLHRTTTCSGRTCPHELVGDPRLQGNDKADHTDQITDVTLRPGRADPEGQALVLRQLRPERHPHPQPQPDSSTRRCSRPTAPSSTGRPAAATWSRSSGSRAARSRSAARARLRGLSVPGWHACGTRASEWPGQPHGFTKLEWNHVFGPSFFLTAKGALLQHRLQPGPAGRAGRQPLDRGQRAAARRAARPTSALFERPQYTLNAGRQPTSRTAMGGNHELQVRRWATGASTARSTRTNPGDKVQLPSSTPTSTRARFYRDPVQREREPATSRRTWATPSPRTASR